MAREMKDSGVAWIGEIPKSWSRTKLFNVLSSPITDGPHETPTLVEDGIPFISVDSLNDSEVINLSCCKKFISENDYFRYRQKAKIEKGDILFSKAATIGKTAIVGDEIFMVWSPLAIIKVNPNMADNKYIYYVLNCTNFIKHISLLGSFNTQINVGMREIEASIISLPDKIEQKLISVFLDRKCAEIDAMLEKTRTSIEEYKKLKQAIITQTVTKGVRGDRPMKESGSIWFGAIPADWGICKTKKIVTIEKRIAGVEGLTVLSITQKGIRPKDLSKNEGQLAASYSNYQIVHPGDFAMNHMDLLTGWIDISRFDGVTSPDYRVFTMPTNSSVNKRYYLYLFQMCYFNRIYYGLGQGVSGLGRWRLPANQFLNFLIPVPPIEEQNEIVEYLNHYCTEIDDLIQKKQKFLRELESYRKSLIYEYVTGKKEVI